MLFVIMAFPKTLFFNIFAVQFLYRYVYINCLSVMQNINKYHSMNIITIYLVLHIFHLHICFHVA